MIERLGAGDGDPQRSHPTGVRYSLSNDAIGSADFLQNHPVGDVRFIEYPTPSPKQLEIREALELKGLVLGRRRTVDAESSQVYKIPTSARPIAYDASVGEEGAYSYNDESLFYDLGSILGELTRLDPTSESLLVGDIGHCVAFVDFTRPNERQIYFIPGVEMLIQDAPDDIEPIQYYEEVLSESFGAHFDDVAVYFRMGFAEDPHGKVE